MRTRAWYGLPVFIAAAVTGCGGDNLTLPGGGVPAKIVASAGDGQSAVVGTAVATPPAVLVTDARDNPVAGALVTFQVVAGSGSVDPSTVATGASGVAAVSSWTFGPTPGVNQLTATVEGSSVSGNPVTFQGTGVGAEANKLVFVVQPRSGTANAAITPAVQVQVQDPSGTPVTSAAVAIGIVLGTNPTGATLTGGDPVTAVNGIATFPNLRVSQGGTGYALAAFATGYVTGASTAFNMTGTGGGGSPGSTRTSVSSSANPSTVGQTVTFTARVTANSGGATPTGTVQFLIDGRNFGSAVGLTNGSAQSQGTSSLTAGTHTVLVTYAPNSASFTASAGTLTQNVGSGPAATTTTVSSSANPSTFGQSVTFTARVTANGGGATPTGSVQFTIDGSDFGSPVSLSNGSAQSQAITSLTPGTHSIQAVYGPSSSSFGASTGSLTQTVNGQVPTTLSLTTSPNPSTFGSPVTLTATVTSTALTPTGAVTFFDGACGSGTSLGSASLTASGTGSATATISVSTLSAGPHGLTGCYPGDATLGPSQGTQTQTVNQLATQTQVSSSVNPSTAGQSVTFTATVSAAVGTPDGTVDFRSGSCSGTDLSGGPVTLSNGQAPFTTASLPGGGTTTTVVGCYSGSTNYQASSGSVNQLVN